MIQQIGLILCQIDNVQELHTCRDFSNIFLVLSELLLFPGIFVYNFLCGNTCSNNEPFGQELNLFAKDPYLTGHEAPSQMIMTRCCFLLSIISKVSLLLKVILPSPLILLLTTPYSRSHAQHAHACCAGGAPAAPQVPPLAAHAIERAARACTRNNFVSL